MRSSFSVGQRVGAPAPLELVEALVVGVLEGLEGAHEVVEGGADVGRAGLGLEGVMFQHGVLFLLDSVLADAGGAAASRMRRGKARFLVFAPARIPQSLEALEAGAMTARASLRVSPASRVSQRSNSRSVGARCAKGRALTAATRASGSSGKVTTEISQRSTFSRRRTPVARSRRPFTARKPIERPSSAPARMSASTSRALATSRIRRPSREEPARVLLERASTRRSAGWRRAGTAS